jgi:hypothetical protein
MEPVVIKALAQYLTLTVATLWVAFVWGKLALKTQQFPEIPLPILLALLAGWGLKVSPDMIKMVLQ